MRPWVIVVLAGAVCAGGLSGLRFWRIAQREHYIAGATTRFAWRWWLRTPLDTLGLAVAIASIITTLFFIPAGLAAVLLCSVLPRGLSIRGRTSRLIWTRRLFVLVGTGVAMSTLAIVLSTVLGNLRIGALVALVIALLFPVFVDVSLALIAPLEDRLARRFVEMARKKIRAIDPVIVAITGSYGKTSTKLYVEHLIGSRFLAVASPRSFNNRAGLARAVNEHLGAGTEVFVAEMGTYGKGEIAELCEWLPPKVAVITAIGPVHLERFKTRDAIVDAKSEITAKAQFIVLNKDDDALRHLGERLESQGKSVSWCSGSDRGVESCVIDSGSTYECYVHGRQIGEIGVDPFNDIAVTNLACAIAVARVLGVGDDEIVARAQNLPLVTNRLVPTTTSEGVIVIDDTFNSNPSGTRRALVMLTRLGQPNARRVVVTPGMVELGSEQSVANEQFGEEAARVVTDFIVVGRTNRNALIRGSKLARVDAPPRLATFETREEAVAFVRGFLGSGDVVLYENDLPDHYP